MMTDATGVHPAVSPTLLSLVGEKSICFVQFWVYVQYYGIIAVLSITKKAAAF
jgi:hypothetical protein